MTTPYPRVMKFLQDGQPVDASTLNVPLETLNKRTNSLNEKVSNALIGAASVLSDIPIIGQNVTVGMAVFRDADGVFHPGLAVLEQAPDGVTLQLAESAYIWGICQRKYSDVLGNVVTHGPLSITETELKAVTVDGEVHTGPLFLAGTVGFAGKLTPTRPPIGVIACLVSGPDAVGDDGESLYTMYVNVGWRDPFEGHIHLHHRMDNDLWEGLDSTNEDGAPDGAQLVYALDDDDVLSVLWPPIPIGAVHYDLDGIAADLVNNTRVTINEFGIWWMSDSLNPEDYDRHDFYFTRMTFKTTDAVVTSLSPLDDSIRVVDADGNDATTGNLKIGANLSFDSSTNVFTGQAVKSVSGLTLNFGPVVEGLTTSTPDLITLSGDELDSPNGDYVGGKVSIGFVPPEGRDNTVSLIELDNIEVRESDGVTYMAMPQSVGCGMTCRVEVPETGLSGTFTLTARLTVWAKAAGTMPDLTTEYFVVERPAVLDTPATLTVSFTPGADVELSGAGAVTAGKYWLTEVEIASGLSPGDIVYFNVERDDSDSYPGDIGILSVKWVLTAE